MILEVTLIVIAFLSFVLIGIFVLKFYFNEKKNKEIIDKKTKLLNKIKSMREEEFNSLIEEQMRNPIVDKSKDNESLQETKEIKEESDS